MAAGVTYTPIATTTIGTAVASYTFSSISSSYTDLVLVASYTTGTISSGFIQFNTDTAGSTNYSNTLINGDGSTAGSYQASNDSAIRFFRAMNGNTGTKNAIINVQNYSNSTTYKTILSKFFNASDVSGACVGLWRNTAAINSIKLTNGGGYNFDVGTTFTLYGIAAA